MVTRSNCEWRVSNAAPLEQVDPSHGLDKLTGGRRWVFGIRVLGTECHNYVAGLRQELRKLTAWAEARAG